MSFEAENPQDLYKLGVSERLDKPIRRSQLLEVLRKVSPRGTS